MMKRAVPLLVLSLLLPLGSLQAGRADEIRKEAFDSLARGVAAYKRGEFVKAIEELERSAGWALNNFRAHYYLGLSYIGDRRYRDAIFPLEIALDLDPTHLMAHVALGDAWLKQGDLAESEAEYYRALELRPEFAPALDGIARIYEAQAKTDKAIDAYQRALASDRGFAQAYTHLGDLYLRLGRVREAVKLLAESVSIRPDFAPGLNRLALAYNRLGLSNEAVAAIRKAIELEPKAASHQATLGRIQLTLGLEATAQETLQRALDLDEAHPETRTGLAEIARRRGHYERALSHIDVALSDPRLDAIERGRLDDTRKRFDDERVRMTALLEKLESGEAAPAERRELAAVFASRDEWGRAAELQRAGLESDDDRERLAYMEFRAGRFREAHTLYASLARAGRPDLYVNEGVALSVLGDDDAAVAAYEKALAENARHREALLYLGNALLRLERRDPAIEAYRRFLAEGEDGEAEERVRRILVGLGVLPEKEEKQGPDFSPLPPQSPREVGS